MADVAIIATQDKQHYGHVIPAMQLGYDILLEKPASTTVQECNEIAQAAKRYNRRVAVCHVLRYTVFYQLLKFYIDSGRIGEAVSVNHSENVGWWHQAHSFVRGNWRNSEESCPMILAKSCHDMDILRWLIGKKCLRVSSFGSTMHFKSECAPAGAAKRCLDGCKAKAACQYDAEKIYAFQRYGSLGKGYSLANALIEEKTTEELYKALREGPYGRCVYHCDNDVVDHQVVNLEFEGGITASFTMCGFTNKFSRDTKIFGTRGDIVADMETNKIYITTFGQPTETIDVAEYTQDFSGHGGGDNRMLEEFLTYVRGDCAISGTLTTIETSIESHIISLSAEQSRLRNGASVDI
jgi:predicted dehydrogenase